MNTYNNKKNQPGIVVVQTAFLGDLLLSISMLKRARQIWPDHNLILVCREGFGLFFLKNKLVDQVYEIQKGNSKSYKEVLKELKRVSVSKVFCLHRSLRSAFFTLKISASDKIGYSLLWNAVFFNIREKYEKSLPDSLRQLLLLRSFDDKLKVLLKTYLHEESPNQLNSKGKLPSVPPWSSMKVDLESSEFSDELDQLLKKINLSHDFLKESILIFPGSIWATKRWPQESFIEVGQAIRKIGKNVLVMGGPGEEFLCEKVSSQIPDAKCLVGQTNIFESFLIMKKSKMMIGNDSASVHLASAAGLPIVVIFGPTVLSFGFRPWSDNVYVVQQSNLACRPCGQHGHKVCPIKSHECMKHISYVEVLEKVKAIIQS